VRSFESHEEVVVVWDNGIAANYRCSGQYDLRIYDSGPTGHSKHIGTSCYACKTTPIIGHRWKCVSCPPRPLSGTDQEITVNYSVDLCSTCYHGDKHNVRHKFILIEQPLPPDLLDSTPPSPIININGESVTELEQRKKSKKVTIRGIFTGARVARGVDWQWDDQDGGCITQKGLNNDISQAAIRRGKVCEIQDWSLVSGSVRSAALVQWDNPISNTGGKNLYRLGFEGMSDLKCLTSAKAPTTAYRDHLPLLGQHCHEALQLYELLRRVPRGLNPNQQQFQNLEIGDRVRIDLEYDVVRALQRDHGGWVECMNEECLKGMRQSATIGSIIGFDEDHDVVVMYPSGNRWTFNAAALTKVNNNIITPTTTVASIANPSASLPSSPQEYSFSVGSTVKISEDLDYVRQLQKGHGEWADGMAMTLGEIGYIQQVYDDGDLKIVVCNTSWTYNPRAVTLISEFNRNNSIAASNSTSASRATVSNIEGSQEESQNDTRIRSANERQVIGSELVRLAANGDVENCRKILENEQNFAHTPQLIYFPSPIPPLLAVRIYYFIIK